MNTPSIQELEESLQRKALEAQLKLLEAQTFELTNYVDPYDRFRDEFGTSWLPIRTEKGKEGDHSSAFSSEQELYAIWQRSRNLVSHNEFAINAEINRTNYTIGTGISFMVTKFDDTVSDAVVDDVQEFINELLEVNVMSERMREAFKRAERDGDCFIRRFRSPDGITLFRFVEPEDIQTPQGNSSPEWRYGILTDTADIETVIAYNLQSEGGAIDASEIYHLKLNVDRSTKRGLSSYYPIRKNLERAEKLLRNMSLVAQVQASIAFVRKHNASANAVQNFANRQADWQIRDNKTGDTERYQRLIPPVILDAHKNQDYDFPTMGVDPAKFVAGLQAELRAVAARFVMPEFMLTSKSDDVNRAAALVAESPSHKNFLALQDTYKRYFLSIVKDAIFWATTVGRLPEEAVTQIKVQCEAPSITVREFLDEQKGNAILRKHDVLSPQTWAQKVGLDYEQEQTNIDEYEERRPAPTPFPLPELDDEDEEEGS